MHVVDPSHCPVRLRLRDNPARQHWSSRLANRVIQPPLQAVGPAPLRRGRTLQCYLAMQVKLLSVGQTRRR